MSTMNATLVWESDWLVLIAGPWRLSVADIEVYSDGTALAHIFGWMPQDFGTITPQPGSDDHNGMEEMADRCEIPCTSRAEAVAVIRALLAVRGVECPDPGQAISE